MVDKKLSEFDEVSNGDVSFFPVLDNNTKNGKLSATKAMPWTNCITEIPQEIKLELSSGTLTLKAGSKVYVPNGAGVFDEVVISNDIIGTSTSSNGLVLYSQDTTNLIFRNFNECFSGTSDPATNSTVYYQTAENIIIDRTSGGVIRKCALPIAVFTGNGTQITSIDQVFNGFGYIGSTIFVLPGVKGLIPDGRNSDGTLKSTSFSNAVAKVYTQTTDRQYYIRCANNYLNSFIYATTYYDEETNEVITNNVKQTQMIAGTFTVSGGKIKEFNPKPTFYAVDYSELKEMISAIDQDTVKLSGNQSYSGIKTATTVNGIQANVSGSNNIIQKNTAVDITNSSRTTAYTNGFSVQDKNEYMAGMFGTTFLTTGSVQSFVQARNRATGSQVQGQISVTVDNAGNIATAAPTPSSVTDNTTKIATTQWFNNKVKQVSTLPANPTTGVYYFVTE